MAPFTTRLFAPFFLVLLARSQTWVPVPLTDPSALCLDGSPGAYHIKAGVGANATKFVLFFQGGGWAMSPADLLYRSTTPLGSTRRDAAQPPDWGVEDLLTGSAARNPQFSTWTSVGLRYCDGGSFSSHLDAPLVVGGTPLHLRGHDILAAAVGQLLSASPGGGAPSLAAATEVLVAGGSAGGLSVLLHVDYIAERIRGANPGAAVAGVANDGFFIDGASIWGGRHFFTGVFQRVVEMGNISTPAQVNGACMAAKAPKDRWQCFMAEYALPHLATRVFILNSFQDEYQAVTMLSPNTSTADAPGGVTQWAPFAPCTHAPWRGCNATRSGWAGGRSSCPARAPLPPPHGWHTARSSRPAPRTARALRAGARASRWAADSTLWARCWHGSAMRARRQGATGWRTRPGPRRGPQRASRRPTPPAPRPTPAR